MLRLFNDILAKYVGTNKPVSSPSVGTNKANHNVVYVVTLDTRHLTCVRH